MITCFKSFFIKYTFVGSKFETRKIGTHKYLEPLRQAQQKLSKLIFHQVSETLVNY